MNRLHSRGRAAPNHLPRKSEGSFSIIRPFTRSNGSAHRATCGEPFSNTLKNMSIVTGGLARTASLICPRYNPGTRIKSSDGNVNCRTLSDDVGIAVAIGLHEDSARSRADPQAATSTRSIDSFSCGCADAITRRTATGAAPGTGLPVSSTADSNSEISSESCGCPAVRRCFHSTRYVAKAEPSQLAEAARRRSRVPKALPNLCPAEHSSRPAPTRADSFPSRDRAALRASVQRFSTSSGSA